MINPEHLIITTIPKQEHGMLCGTSTGVRVEHIPTGCAVECVKHRSMLKNRNDAIAVLELLIEN